MNKRMAIVLITIIILCTSYFIFHQYIKSNIFPIPNEKTIPFFENSKLISIKSGRRTANGLLINSGKKIVIMFHGNGSTINSEKNIADIFVSNGFSVLLVEYPGYGISGKSDVSEKNIYQDSIILINYIQTHFNYSNTNIVLLGYSLGSSIVIDLSSKGIGSKNIIMSSFTSMDDMIALQSTKLIGTIFNTEKFNSIKKASKINSPTIILHGNNDNYIPFKMSQELHKHIKNSILVPIQSRDHSKMYTDISDSDWKIIFNFLKDGES